LATQEALEEFIQEIKRQIDEADKATKKRADAILQVISENYNDRISETLANEVLLLQECREAGDEAGIRHHKMLCEIYKSMMP